MSTPAQHRFLRYSLRTLDLPGARAFYLDALGLDLTPGPAEGPLEVWPLHERARSAGVPAHWLGQLAVESPERVRDAVVSAGGMALGPIVNGPNGRYATLRDPSGAVFAASTAADPGPGAITWHHLCTPDVAASSQLYADLFQWDTEDPGAWRVGGEAFASTADLGVDGAIHPHWLFFFPVQDVVETAARIRAAGGLALAPFQLAGRTLAACEDPQGAAFGILGPPTA